MSKRRPMITVTRAADEAGVSRSFLLGLLRDGNAETVELRNPHYRSADPMLVVAVDDLARVLAANTEAVDRARRRSSGAKKAAATAAENRASAGGRLRAELEEMSLLADSLGDFARAAFWLSQVPAGGGSKSLTASAKATGSRVVAAVVHRGFEMLTLEGDRWVEVRGDAGTSFAVPGWTAGDTSIRELLRRSELPEPGSSGTKKKLRGPFGRKIAIQVLSAEALLSKLESAGAKLGASETELVEATWGSRLGDEQRAWAAAGFTAMAAETWRRVGASPQVAAVCELAGIGVGEVSDLLSLGVPLELFGRWRPDVENLRTWVIHGFDPQEASVWSGNWSKRGAFSPSDAEAWRLAGAGYYDAEVLRSAQLAPADIAALGVDRVPAFAEYVGSGVAASAAAALSRNRTYVPPDEARRYVESGWSPDEAVALWEADVGAREASSWRDVAAARGLQQVLSWQHVCCTPELAEEWMSLDLSVKDWQRASALRKHCYRLLMGRLRAGATLQEVLDDPPLKYKQLLERKAARREASERRGPPPVGRAARLAASRAAWAEHFGVPLGAIPPKFSDPCTEANRKRFAEYPRLVPRTVREALARASTAAAS